MPTDATTLLILLAEDDPEAQTFAREALAATRLANARIVVQDGQELLDYLQREGAYPDAAAAPRPGLILPPRRGGR